MRRGQVQIGNPSLNPKFKTRNIAGLTWMSFGHPRSLPHRFVGIGEALV